MPIELKGLRVFIASPGGLSDERNAIRKEIADFDQISGVDFGVSFIADGYELAPGGSGRAQANINERLRKCDYMILVLHSRWGTKPDRDGHYSSGTEEEFRVGERCLTDPNLPMLDILILFKGISDELLADPGKEVTKVLNFKREIEQSWAHFYKTFDDIGTLQHEVRNRLTAWARDYAGGIKSVPQEAPLTPLPSGEQQGTSPDESESIDPVTALQTAKQFEAQGLVSQAEGAYARATQDGEPESLMSYARFLRRTGRLSKSLAVNRRVLEELANSADSEKNAAQRSETLANIGIILRKQGKLLDSRHALQEAVETAKGGGVAAQDSLAYALDNLGITSSRSGDNHHAKVCYEEALRSRRDSGDKIGEAKTLTNLASLYRRTGQLSEAEEACGEAVKIFTEGDDKPSLAAALSSIGEIQGSLGKLNEAEEAFRSALSINESLGTRDGIAMNLVQLSRILLGKDDGLAETYARRALAENEQTSNREGEASTMHVLGRIYAATGRGSAAVGFLRNAVDTYHGIGNSNGEGWALLHLSDALAGVGKEAEAAETRQQALYAASASGNVALVEELAE